MPIVKGVTCPVCGCLCDDIEVIVKNNQILKAKNACAIGAAKLLDYRNNRIKMPLIRKNGKLVEATLEKAIRKSAEILSKAKYPILYGWSSTSCEAVRKGLELAEMVGGVIDNTTTTCHGPSILSIHDVGISSCTLGQLRHRADLIIYWGCDPWSAHPRHIERYTTFARGRFQTSDWSGYVKRTNILQAEKRKSRISKLKHAKEVSSQELVPVPYKLFRKSRKMVVIDIRKTHTAEMADYFLQVQPNTDYELLEAFRMLIRDEELEV
ncbi:MAG: formylmethanofuran dehydrogenase subunit, partial [Thermoproteota archaeon]|nr:formylmethanofuran dehydrogenase subunit [Thermoproteota archaeon]